MKKKTRKYVFLLLGLILAVHCNMPGNAQSEKVKTPVIKYSDKIPPEAIGVWTRRFKERPDLVHIYKICPPNMTSLVGADYEMPTFYGTLTFKNVSRGGPIEEVGVKGIITMSLKDYKKDGTVHEGTDYFYIMKDNSLAFEKEGDEVGFDKLEKSPCP